MTKIFEEWNHPVTVAKWGILRIFSSEPVFFLMFEDGPGDFIFTAFLRTLLFRRTAVLLFRPGECLSSTSLRHTVKRWLLMAFKWLPLCTVMTLLPFEIDQRFRAISKGYIYDPNLWDLKYLDWATKSEGEGSEFRQNIERAAAGRQIVAAIGFQNNEKGFDFFCDIWNQENSNSLREDFLFVSAGHVSEELKSNSKELEKNGGLLFDRMITNEELSILYSVSAFVWCCYAPDYNQASGIFSRAVQYGRPTVVRAGSYVASFARLIDHPAIEVAWGHTDEVVSRLTAPPFQEPEGGGERKIEEMREHSLRLISQALSIPRPTVSHRES